jgi:hypothetical protein
MNTLETMSSTKLNYRSLLLVGVGLPAVLVLTNQLITTAVNQAGFSTNALAALGASFVAQIAITSWLAGRYLAPWPLQWLVWFWVMCLMDFQFVGSRTMDYRKAAMLDGMFTAMLTGQLSAVTIWGILGKGPLLSRLPSLLFISLMGVIFLCRLVWVGQQRTSTWTQLEWPDLLVVQTLLLSALCCIIRVSGFVLATCDDQTVPQLVTGSPIKNAQFSIRETLIGISIISVTLAIAKACDLLTLQFARNFHELGLLFVVAVALATTVVLLVAVWASLGQGRLWWRVAGLLSLTSVIGYFLAIYSVKAGRLFDRYSYALKQLLDLRYGWVGWMMLTGCLSAASLLIYRAMGYRLSRNSGTGAVVALAGEERAAAGGVG